MTPERATAFAWIFLWWRTRDKAEAVLLDYRAMYDDNRLAVADLARFCFAGDSVFDPDPVRLAANVGRQEAWLHLKAMLQLDETDTQNLLERTEEE